jgi:hypothetical protein
VIHDVFGRGRSTNIAKANKQQLIGHEQEGKCYTRKS